MKKTDEKPVADAPQREAAIDPERSFIVQAPAGSGKTELLIQRFLRLLTGVNAPEEIVAITFTRKAAAEMRTRILNALERAQNSDPPQKPHEYRTWLLATAAEEQNNHKGWHLTENPGRLRIQTIDALCAAMTRQMPYLSRLGAPPEISEDPREFYRQAARETVAELETGSKWSPAMEALIRHLDNQLETVEQLIAEMLARRDQWLRHIAGGEALGKQRRHLEEALKTVIREALEAARQRFPAALIADLLDLACFASGNLEKDDAASPIIACRDLNDLPEARAEALEKWLGLCELLLTKDGHFRRQSNRTIGFPAPSSVKKKSELKYLYEEKKSAFKALIGKLEAAPGLAERLNALRCLPDPAYRDAEWEIMQALSEALRLAVGHLALVFQSAGKMDFAQVAISADFALGTSDSPTDLALSMDYRIQHIMIDEFQDTSITQFRLLEKMTMGWQPGDGRTFFAVGDPMQSIYGFREAEVGLFIKAWKQGLGQIELHPLALRVNFRSQKGIVDWLNDSFPMIMPRENDASVGAVAYYPAVPAVSEGPDTAVRIHPFIPPDREQEAQTVLDCIRKAQDEAPEGSIAILVRSRPHLETIIRHLKSSGVSFTAVEIESLKNRPVIQDLLSLSRALSHPCDRIAWLAVLRAPWCGLSLHDLHLLAGDAPKSTVVELLNDDERIRRLSKEGRCRALRCRDVLMPRILNLERRSLRRMVEGAWLSLGGPACCFSTADFEDAKTYLDFLDETVGMGTLNDIQAFESEAAALFARPDPEADQKLQVMTIHKAKGLEFDTVILPGLDKYPPAEPSRLLLWLERPGASQHSLILAPIAESGRRSGKTYEYIRQFEKKKRAYEDCRLLYVAVTRAKKRLHLMGGAKTGAEPGSLGQPDATSLLYPLWPVVYDSFLNADRNQNIASPSADKEPTDGRNQPTVPYIRRLQADWRPPGPPPGLDDLVSHERGPVQTEAQTPPFDWAGETVRRIGSVVHRWLRIICEDGVEKWSRERVAAMTQRFYRQLKRCGISETRLDDGVIQVKSALIQSLDDPMGRWILSRQRSEACEYALTGSINGKTVNIVIDRTFIDERGVRWIVDYKSSVHSGGAVAAFLDREKERYREQMERYARIIGAMESRPIRLMLYFPQLKDYREWPAA